MHKKDPHLALEVMDVSLDEMKRIHLVPFVEAKKAGIPSMMVNHAIYPPFDRYIGFEAVPKLCQEAIERFKGNDKVSVINKAVSIENKKDVKFYMCYCKEKGGCKGKGTEIGTGSTLLKKKIKGNIDKSKFIYVDVINFSKYILDNFNISDDIFLKVDIEGSEYELFDHMIKSGAIKYIDKYYHLEDGLDKLFNDLGIDCSLKHIYNSKITDYSCKFKGSVDSIGSDMTFNSTKNNYTKHALIIVS